MIPQEIYEKENRYAKAEAVKKTSVKFGSSSNYINSVIKGRYAPANETQIKAYFLEQYWIIKKKVSEALTA